MIKRVGVIGLGKMGHPMVRHLLRTGHAVAAYDIEPQAVEKALELGAKGCANPRELAAQSELTIIVVGFDNEVLDVLGGGNGVLAGASPNAVIAVASTVYPETMKNIAADAEKLGKGISVLDIPLCRGEPAAEAGKLLMLVGGDEPVLARCRPAFSSFADDIFLLGGHGAGQIGKMINNLLLWASVCANHEGLKLAAALGVEPERLRQALLKSSGRNWALETWVQARPMPWAEKDMAIVMHAADAARLSLPLAGVIREVIKAVKRELGAATSVARK
jgi:3-hydroxyisobutyrate dehydrogenase-like beta-hydroxyacid dehydrogenase